MDLEKIKQEYKKIMLNLPEVYKVKYNPKAITQIQILAILKIFIEKDEKREGIIESNKDGLDSKSYVQLSFLV
jgi:hypothetical protein